MDTLIKERIKAGIQYLDQNYPEWIDKINLDGLHMDSAGLCIMGQLEPDGFFNSPLYRNGGEKKCAELGFLHSVGILDNRPITKSLISEAKVELDVLTEEWKKQVLILRN